MQIVRECVNLRDRRMGLGLLLWTQCLLRYKVADPKRLADRLLLGIVEIAGDLSELTTQMKYTEHESAI